MCPCQGLGLALCDGCGLWLAVCGGVSRIFGSGLGYEVYYTIMYIHSTESVYCMLGTLKKSDGSGKQA